jgi:hypothetical protein
MALQSAIVNLLEQIFEETAYVGSVCLAGPDPEKGGKLMTASYVHCYFLFENPKFMILLSRIHLPFANGSNFGNVYPNYQVAVSDPMRAYSSLFFRAHLWFPPI